jgi:hypothetical protein
MFNPSVPPGSEKTPKCTILDKWKLATLSSTNGESEADTTQLLGGHEGVTEVERLGNPSDKEEDEDGRLVEMERSDLHQFEWGKIYTLRECLAGLEYQLQYEKSTIIPKSCMKASRTLLSRL